MNKDFVYLTRINPKQPIIVNVDHISEIEYGPGNRFTIIRMSNGNEITVTELPENVLTATSAV